MLIQEHIGISKYTRPGTKLRSISNIVWHYTANPRAGARNHFRYFSTLTDRKASAHIFIDKTEALEIVPLDEVAYHAGDVTANNNTIGIELCIEKDGSFHPETLHRAIEVAKQLCERFKIDPMKMIRHYDVTRKLCPLRWVEHPHEFIAFKTEVKKSMETKQLPQWKLDVHAEALKNGVITSDWSQKLDEPAPVWMVLAISNNMKARK